MTLEENFFRQCLKLDKIVQRKKGGKAKKIDPLATGYCRHKMNVIVFVILTYRGGE